MSDMTLIPTGSGGSDALAAGGGALLGSIFGNGFLGNRGLGGVAAAEVGLGGAGVIANQAILDGISTLQSGQTNLGMNILNSVNGVNTTVERAASSTYTGLTAQNTQGLLASVQGFAGLNTVIQATGNASVAAVGAASALATNQSFEARLAAERCCCETNLNIERQANQTRDLMRDQFATSQAVLICDMKSQIQQRDFLLSQAAQSAHLDCKINNLAQLVNFKLPTPPTPPTGCC